MQVRQKTPQRGTPADKHGQQESQRSAQKNLIGLIEQSDMKPKSSESGKESVDQKVRGQKYTGPHPHQQGKQNKRHKNRIAANFGTPMK